MTMMKMWSDSLTSSHSTTPTTGSSKFRHKLRTPSNHSLNIVSKSTNKCYPHPSEPHPLTATVSRPVAAILGTPMPPLRQARPNIKSTWLPNSGDSIKDKLKLTPSYCIIKFCNLRLTAPDLEIKSGTNRTISY